MSYHMAEKNPKKTRTQSDYLSDSNSSKEEVSQHLHTSPEEKLYNTVKGSAQVMQVALAHTTAQCNPTVERGPPKQPKIKKLPKEQTSDKSTQTKEKDKPLCYINSSNSLYFLYQYIFVTLLRCVYL